MMESRMPLWSVLRGIRIVALSISSHEQTQLNRVFCFLPCRFSLFLVVCGRVPWMYQYWPGGLCFLWLQRRTYFYIVTNS